MSPLTSASISRYLSTALFLDPRWTPGVHQSVAPRPADLGDWFMHRELTDAYLRTLKPPPGTRLEIWDGRQVDLMVRVTSKKASWSTRTRTKDGKRTRVGLGDWPAVGIA